MNLKQLEQAKSLYLEIQIIDEDIKKYDKMAVSLADLKPQQKVEFSIVVKTPNKRRRDKKQDMSFAMFSHRFFPGRHPMSIIVDDFDKPAKPDFKQEAFTEVIEDVTALEVLGLLIKQKLASKARLLGRLRRLGVTI